MIQVILTPQAQKDLKKIPIKKRLKIRQKAQLLQDNPLLGKKLKRELKKCRSLKVWPYRVIYEIFKNKVWIEHIIHRQQAYK